MKTRHQAYARYFGSWSLLPFLLVLGGVAMADVVAQTDENSEPRASLAGEQAIQQLKRAMTNEDFNVHYGKVGFRTEARLGASYTDNVFLSPNDAREDFIINPEVDLTAFVPLTEINALNLSLGLSYEWFAKNHDLNGDLPLINPGSELAFNIFAGDFRIKLHDKFSYQQTLVFNQQSGDQMHIYNFTNVGRFDRLDNFVGPTVDWDLNKVILSVGYDHENFITMTERFKYLDRSSEFFTASANYLLGRMTKAGVEAQGALHNYEHETILNDNWRVRVGPFSEVRLPEGMTLRAGGGYDAARFDALATPGNNYDTWYAYGKLQQETKWFTHSVAAGRETLLGDNANNLRTTYLRYSISSDALKDIELEGHFSANFSKEFGGDFHENFVQYAAGCRLGYQFHKYWRAGLAYELFLNESETADRSFHRNLVSLDVTFKY